MLPEGLIFGIAIAGHKIVFMDAVKLWTDITSLSIQNQRDGVCMAWRVAQEDANTRMIRPLVVRMLGLKSGIKDIDGGAKWVKMGQIGLVWNRQELRKRGSMIPTG